MKEEYERKLSGYVELEKHIEQARAKVLSEEERHLELVREEHPTFDQINLIRSIIASDR